MKLLKFILLFYFATSCTLCLAENKNSLFGDDFVKSPIQKRGDLLQKRAPILEQRQNSEVPAKQPNQNQETRKVIDREVTAVTNQLVKVRSIGMILNCMDDRHFLDSVNSFKNTALQHDFPIATVICHGRFGLGYKSANKELVALIMLGAHVQTRYELPEPYSQLRMSPTWIVETDEGENWLEATGKSFDQYFTPRGQFIVPNNQSGATADFFSKNNDLFQ
ncbi:MAG: hypothetical protein KDD62_10660 [Bdellovibrionales bacterium]|nr:hypothetical protein [Bdellovibrionales bacterium]